SLFSFTGRTRGPAVRLPGVSFSLPFAAIRGEWRHRLTGDAPMPSPFPGMNPYLERASVWHDFHEALIVDIRRALVPQIRPAFIATQDDNIYVHELSAQERRFPGRSDVSVAKVAEAIDPDAGGVAVSAPVTGRVLPAVDVLRENFIEIRDRE